MEDRKRSLAPDAVDELASSRKRLLKDENGQAMRMDAEKEKDVENFQKDALLRQMKEYKRQKKDFEERYHELSHKCRYHDDHLRTIDAWFSQLLDEVRLLAAQSLPTPPPSAPSNSGQEMYASALLFENSVVFSEHLQARSQSIRGAISDFFGRLPSSPPAVEDLRRHLNDLLAKDKEHAIELRKALDEQESLNERLEAASYRYMTAEKKLDRAKSTQVLKLERQAMMGGNGEASSPTNSKKSATPVKKEQTEINGEIEDVASTAEADAARKEAMAVVEKQKAQVEEVDAENERLTNELSAARTRLASLTDDDYAQTSLFKSLKAQYEDVVKRINDLEATNVQLREESQKLHSERTTYRSLIDEEHRTNSNEIEAQIARSETDLARIRDARDQLIAEISVRKADQENRRTASDQARELAEARDARIASLESEVERLMLQCGEVEPKSETNVDHLDAEALKVKLRTLENQYSLLSNELPSMEAAWKKTQAMAAKRVDELVGWEEQIARLSAEKAKADQKYFAAMKAKDMREGELRTLKQQNARSSEIVTQLKDTEGKTRELVTNLERQLVEARENLTKVEQQHRTLEQKSKEANLVLEGLQKQIDELKALIAAKDKDSLSASKSKREAEEEVERCRSRLEDTKKQYEGLRKTKADMGNSSSDDWRKVAICPVCNSNIRNTVLRLCGHVFCNHCVKDLISNRSRKCPSCLRAFGASDQMGILLT